MLARRIALALAALLVTAPSAGAQALPAPSLSRDLTFAPPSGIARFDFAAGTIADVPAGVAVYGERTYTVGRTQGGSGGQDIGIVARRADGAFDTGFSGDGRHIVAIAPGTGADLGTGIAVLADGRLRVIAATDAAPGAGESLDVAIVGLNPDGTPDATFGAEAAGGGRTGTVVFAVGSNNDVPARIAAAPDGRLAVVGSRSDGARDDLFVSVREADGRPAAFGDNGVKVLDRGGTSGATSLTDRGIDVEFRPGGGVLALAVVETNPGASVTDYVTALHAFTAGGADDPSFSDDGDLVLDVGEPDTVPGAMALHGGRVWVTGSTRVGADTDAFLARVEADGRGLQSRRFDIRGDAISSDQPVVTRTADLAVAQGPPQTLVAVGLVEYTSATGASTTDWGAAAFNNLDGDLAAAGFGDEVLPAPGQGGAVGVAAGGERWLAVAGVHVDSSIADNSFGNARLLLDADKRCDLAVSVAEPAEVVFSGGRPSALTARVVNEGSRPCAGVVTVAAPYRMTPVATGVLLPGASFTTPGTPVVYTGPRRPEDILRVSVAAAGDANPANNQAAAHVVFSYCDLGVRAVGRPDAIPSEGTRRLEVLLRNRGTAACRVRVGGRAAYVVQAGRSASDWLRAAAPRGARAGRRVRMTLRVRADQDVTPADNAVTISARVVRVGDSDIRRATARSVSGTATGGAGRAAARGLRPRRVQVALVRVTGRRCAWLRSTGGAVMVRRARGGDCGGPPRWLTAKGTSRWRLALRRRLPKGRYVAYSRVTIAAGFGEARFTRRDRNRVAFRVR